MATNRKKITVAEDTFRELKGHKGHHTWDGYLLDLKDDAQGGPTVGLNDEDKREIVQAVADEIETRLV